MKLGNTVFCLLLLGGLSTSCIREDLSDCFSTNTLLLSYKGDGETEIFGDKICRVEMYVFDAENRCVANGVLPPNEVEARAAKLPQLKPGDYRIVCLGNTHHTQVATSLRAISAGLPLPTAAISPGRPFPATIRSIMRPRPLRWNLSPAGRTTTRHGSSSSPARTTTYRSR